MIFMVKPIQKNSLTVSLFITCFVAILCFEKIALSDPAQWDKKKPIVTYSNTYIKGTKEERVSQI